MTDRARQPHQQDLGSRPQKARKILRLLQLAPRATPWRVLEVGTGSGGIAHWLATQREIPCEVTSVDVVDVREVRDGFEFHRVDGTTLPFADDAFDVVITNHVIEHVGDADAQQAHLRECARVLAPEGRGYVSVPNRWMLVEPHFRLAFLSWLPHAMRDAYVRLAGRGTHYDCEPLTLPELERFLAGAGFAHENLGVPALRELFRIEGTRTLAQKLVARLPDTLLRKLDPVNPTLIYRVWHAADR